MGKRGGIKGRLNSAELPDSERVPATTCATVRKGGVRHRIQAGSSLESNDNAEFSRGGGLKKGFWRQSKLRLRVRLLTTLELR